MDHRLRDAVRNLDRDFPLRDAVQVRTVATLICPYRGRLFGMAERPKWFVITIQRHADMSVQIDTLWHEWTHCLVWPDCREKHDERFWRTYGRIYSHYQD